MELNDLEIDNVLNELNYSISKEQKKYFELESLDIKALVNNLLNEKKEFKVRPLNLASVMEHLNLNAEYKENVEKFVELDYENKIIYINKDNVDMKHKIYQIAVEIGKFALNNYYGINNSLKREALANIFAIELLMPYKEFRNRTMIGYSIDSLKDYFNVPYEVAYYRYNFICKKVY